jgi:hypothetical protein
LTSAAIAISAAPADAAWKSYVSKELGFSFMAPGDIKAELGTYRGDVAGPRQTVVFKSTEDNIEYKVTVLRFAQSQADGAILLGEREFTFRQRKDVVADSFSQVGTGKDSVYGNKIVVDLPDKKGRTTGAFYFTNGKLYALEAAMPANGNFASPDPGRFVDSIKFGSSSAEPGAVELQTPQVE